MFKKNYKIVYISETTDFRPMFIKYFLLRTVCISAKYSFKHSVYTYICVCVSMYTYIYIATLFIHHVEACIHPNRARDVSPEGSARAYRCLYTHPLLDTFSAALAISSKSLPVNVFVEDKILGHLEDAVRCRRVM